MLIQITTNLKLIFIKNIDNNRCLCEYYEDNCLYNKGKKGVFYKTDLREINIFDFIGDN